MKKLVLFATAIVAISFASCNNKPKEDAAVAPDTTATIETPAPATVDTTATPVDTAATSAAKPAATK